MPNPDTELNRLHTYLVMRDIPAHEANEIVDLAANDIANTVQQLMTEAVDEAAQVAASMGADRDVISQIRAERVGNTYSLFTTSGITDFSMPPLRMLPHLLRNPKVAEDGSLYKVIPIKKRATTNLDEVHAKMNEANLQEVSERKLQQKQRLEDIKGVNLSGLRKARDLVAKRVHEPQLQEGGEVDFKTASSKQDAASSWVLPEKDLDIGPLLRDISARLNTDVNSAIAQIISEYERIV